MTYVFKKGQARCNNSPCKMLSRLQSVAANILMNEGEDFGRVLLSHGRLIIDPDLGSASGAGAFRLLGAGPPLEGIGAAAKPRVSVPGSEPPTLMNQTPRTLSRSHRLEGCRVGPIGRRAQVPARCFPTPTRSAPSRCRSAAKRCRSWPHSTGPDPLKKPHSIGMGQAFSGGHRVGSHARK